MNDDMLSTTEVTMVANVSFRHLDYWALRGYLRPVGQGAGSGAYRTWPDAELRIAALMRRLIDAGLMVAAAADVVRRIVESSDTTWTWKENDKPDVTYIELAPGVHVGLVGDLP